MKFIKILSALALIHTLLLPGLTRADDKSIVELNIPDLELIDQNSQSSRFISETIGDQLAVITFTYTNCSTICPMLDGIFSQLQSRLGEDLGRETVLLTISIDPVNDIAPQLKAHATELGAQPGWNFLTGDKTKVTQLLKAVEVFSPDIINHPSTIFVVDGSRQTWTRLNGFPAVETILEVLDDYRQTRS